MIEPSEVVPKGFPEKKVPAVKTEPLLKVMELASTAVRRWAVATVEGMSCSR
jgi:hypothetical protein